MFRNPARPFLPAAVLAQVKAQADSFLGPRASAVSARYAQARRAFRNADSDLAAYAAHGFRKAAELAAPRFLAALADLAEAEARLIRHESARLAYVADLSARQAMTGGR